MFAWAKHSSSANGIRNMGGLAKSDLAIGPGELDTDPWLFNVLNGTINLRIGRLRKHRREDFITKVAPVTFDPKAACPRWQRFLEQIFAEDQQVIKYTQRLVGYSLTGVTDEHLLPILYGTGANGKSTFSEMVMNLMGLDYSMKAPPDLLMAKRGESHPTERADLFGKRFVACIEVEEGRRMAEALVKELTGGDRIRARRMREDFWEFVPTHHVWLAVNHKPIVTGSDKGIWRRLKLIPFEVVIPPDQQDRELKRKLAAELPGILNWAIAGCLDWQRGGMQEPRIVTKATTSYSAEMDDVGQFIEEYCVLGDHHIESATLLYQAFVQAVPDSGLSQKAFASRLKQKGFTNKDMHGKDIRGRDGRSAWKGLRL
jgi:putative DNA primase/helicase